MKTILVVITLALSGCYQSISENDIRNAERMCSGRENVSEIYSHVTGVESVECRDGVVHSLNRGP